MSEEIERAIDVAIKREQATYSHYSKLARAADTTNLETFFRQLAMQEAKHECLLQEFKKTKDFQAAKEQMEAQYINTNFIVTDYFNPNTPTEGIPEGFMRSIRQEQEDAMFYREIMNRFGDQHAKDLFHYLIGEEEEHERLIRKEYFKFKSSKQ